MGNEYKSLLTGKKPTIRRVKDRGISSVKVPLFTHRLRTKCVQKAGEGTKLVVILQAVHIRCTACPQYKTIFLLCIQAILYFRNCSS